MSAAPIPTMRYGTPRALSASNRARSADVRTSSNTGQTSAEPLLRREIERTKGVVDIAGIHAGIRRRDGVRLAPDRFALQNPGALVLRQLLVPWLTLAHE